MPSLFYKILAIVGAMIWIPCFVALLVYMCQDILNGIINKIKNFWIRRSG